MRYDLIGPHPRRRRSRRGIRAPARARSRRRRGQTVRMDHPAVPDSVPAGPVAFTVTNTGSIPHALEVEGHGPERETPLIQPGASAKLTLTSRPGSYEIYCPVAGTRTRNWVWRPTSRSWPRATGRHRSARAERARGIGDDRPGDPGDGRRAGDPDPARAVPLPRQRGADPQAFGPEREALESQIQNGPYSNNVAPISGRFTFRAWDKGAVRDSVDGAAEFTTGDPQVEGGAGPGADARTCPITRSSAA